MSKILLSVFPLSPDFVVRHLINTEDDSTSFELINGRVLYTVNSDALLFDSDKTMLGHFRLDTKHEWYFVHHINHEKQELKTRDLLLAETIIVRELLKK